MELSMHRIQQLSAQQIMNIFQEDINQVYKQFSFLELSREAFKHIVLSEIEKSKQEYTGNLSYSAYLKSNITKALINETSKLLAIPQNAIKVISSYTDTYLSSSSTSDNSLKNLNQLSNFLNACEYFPDQEILIELLNKNDKFLKMIEAVVQKYYPQIVAGKSAEIFDNEITILSIETYCLIKRIEIKKTIDQSQYDYDEQSPVTDSVKKYLNEISSIPLLTPEQERKIAIRIAYGDEEAKKIMIESNLRLVVKVAKKYINLGVDFLDLIQEGNLGLITAVERYDVSKGNKFSTYAVWWIRQSISRAIREKSRNIKIPVQKYDDLYTLNKTVTKLEALLQRRPTIEEVANEMGEPLFVVQELYQLSQDTISMNVKVDDDKETEMGALISKKEQSPEDLVIVEDMKKQLHTLLNSVDLTPQEYEVTKLRFGLESNEKMTLEEISQRFHVTRERIRQIEYKVLKKLRRSNKIKEYAVFMSNPDEALKAIDEFRTIYSKNKESKCISMKNYRSQERNGEMNYKYQTLYQHFPGYTEKHVNEVLKTLTNEERNLLKLKYGEDLKTLTGNQLSREQSAKISGSILLKIKRRLINPYNSKKSSKGSVKKDKTSKVKKGAKVISLSETKQRKPEKIEKKTIESSDQVPKETSAIKRVAKKDLIKILELLKTPTFKQMMSNLTVKEAVIISLRLGYIDGKYFSVESISQFLGIEPEEVNEITQKVLVLYRDTINEFIDQAIAYTTPSNTRIREPKTNGEKKLDEKNS